MAKTVKAAKLGHRELPRFTAAEFAHRVERAQKLMTEQKLDGMLLSVEQNIEYLSGFISQFPWSSPSRPWYFVIDRDGNGTGIIPEFGETCWRGSSWAETVMTWPSPRPENEGIDLVAKAISGIKRKFGRFGMEFGLESRLGTTMGDMMRIADAIRPFEAVDCIPVMRRLRYIKSKAEIAHIRHACTIGSDTFDAMAKFIADGDSESEICRKFGAHALLLGADKVPFTAIGTGKGGYDSIVQGPSDRRVRKGDIVFLDTGVKYRGYFCDFDRNFALGEPPDEAKRLHALLWRATEVGIKAAVPGNTAEGVFLAQAKVLEDAGIVFGNVGRMGHGLGKNMTEYPSNMLGDKTVLEVGTVLTIEPGAMFGKNKILVHEEDLVVTEDGPKLLTRRCTKEMPVVKV
jgi:Xaa-Pro aminopeptidase